MKKIILLTIASTMLGSLPVNASTIRGVLICATECNSEILGHQGHSDAYVGKIYYANATPENSSNNNECLNNAKTIEVHSNRMDDHSLKNCANALMGKYDGIKVDLEAFATEVGQEDAPFFDIRISDK
ncbi:MAG: hypothetical protein PHY93_19265 [Bacteriovorax sp.]|nr:hypothetical protein [Bacteriovorax sp.]